MYLLYVIEIKCCNGLHFQVIYLSWFSHNVETVPAVKSQSKLWTRFSDKNKYKAFLYLSTKWQDTGQETRIQFLRQHFSPSHTIL
jgi:hypothetical protein